MENFWDLLFQPMKHGTNTLHAALIFLFSICYSCSGKGFGETHPLASSELAEVLAGRDVLVPSRTSNSRGGPGAVHANTVARCTVFPPTHWCGWLLG